MIISGKRTFLTNRRFWRIVVNVVVLTALLYFFQAGLASLFSQNYSIKFNWQYADSTDSFSLFYLQDNTWIQESQAPLSSPLSLSDDFLSSNVFVLKFDSKATKLSLETVDVFFNQQVIGSLDSGIIYDAIEDYQNIKFVENTDIPSLNFTLEPGAQITFNDIFSESIVNMISNHHYTYIFPSIAFFFFILSVFAVNHLAKLLSKYLKDTIIDVGYVFIVFALWLLGQKFINHTILLVLSIGLLVRFIYNDIHNKSFFSLISSTVLLCLLTAITNFSPKEYTGELIYTATPSTNVSTYITYDNNNTFERLETTVQSNGLNFEILPTLGNAENIVINFSQSEPQQHSLLVEIDRLNIYCNNFLIDSITGSDLASSCRSLLNLQLIDSSRKSLYLEWNVDDYAQICLNSTFSNRLVSAQNGNFINLLSAVYYTLTILIFIRICNYIIYALKNRHYISTVD